MISLLRSVGADALHWGRYANDLFWFFVHAVVVALRGGRRGERVTRRTTLYQIYFTGVDAMGVVTVLALLIGTVIIVQTMSLLTDGGKFVGALMDVVIIRQLGPLMTAFIVIGRSGSSIAVELGNMKVGGEIDLLEAMGIDPTRFLVLPRMIGVTWAVLCLTILFDIVSMLGGYAVSSLVLDTPLSTFLVMISERLTISGLVIGLFKSALFGTLIATISTWQGLAVDRAITEVPQATRRCVVHSIVGCVGLNALLTVLLRSL